MAKQEQSSQSVTIFHKSLLPQEEMLEIKNKRKQLSIGIPKETNKNENRVAITPLSIEVLVQNGHKIIVEENAGIGANFTDLDFSNAGAIIVSQKEEVLQCDVVLKISAFTRDEIKMLKGNQLVISALNIGILSGEDIRLLINKRVTALAFELLSDNNNCLPVMRSMSEITGRVSILMAAEYLCNEKIGMGKILGSITGVNPSEVVIIGAGTAGEFATRTALGLGALVKVFDDSVFKLKNLQQSIGYDIFSSILQPNILLNSLKTADVVIGAINLMDHKSGYIVTEDMVKEMKKGSVIIDISIDQGGCFETSRITSHDDPVFVNHGVVHYCVPNIPSKVSRSASYALSNIFAPILTKIGNSGGISNLIRDNKGIRDGIYIYNGILTNSYIGNHFGISSQDINLLTAAF